MQQTKALVEKPDETYPEILDVQTFAAGMEAIANEHQSDRDVRRTALLAYLKDVSQEGRAKAREILNRDGSGMGCARRISWLEDQIIIHT